MITKHFICLIFSAVYLFLQPEKPFEPQNSPELRIEITNIKHDKGKILAAIYSSKEDFLTTPLQYRASEIKAGKTSVEIIFEGLEANEYAISIFHDENGNGILDKNMLGIPKEPFGFSNNAKAKFSPPTFDECSVDISQLQSEVSNPEDAKSLVIRLKNW